MPSSMKAQRPVRMLRASGADFLPPEASLAALPLIGTQQEIVSGDAGYQLGLRFLSRDRTFYLAELDIDNWEAFGLMVTPWAIIAEYVSLPLMARASVFRVGEVEPSPVWKLDPDFTAAPAWKCIPAFMNRAADRLPPSSRALLRDQYAALQTAARGESDESEWEASERLDRFAARFGLYLGADDLTVPFESITSCDRWE